MAGTKAGGLKAARTIKKKHGKDFYKGIGKLGGTAGTTGGFYYSKMMGNTTHIEAGRLGGQISRRGPAK